MLFDVKTLYILRALPQLRKEERLDDADVAEHVVQTLMNPYCKTDQSVLTDDFFTSTKTAEKLLKRNITTA